MSIGNNNNNWLGRLLSNESYHVLGTADSSPVVNMPGGFEEEVNTQRRNVFNSQSINHLTKKLCRWINIIIIIPVIKVIVLLFRTLAGVINTIYFKDIHLGSANSGSNHTNDPIDRAAKFLREMEDNLRPDQLQQVSPLLPFYQGSYSQALYIATQRAKFLFVYLTNPQNEGSTRFFQGVIANPKFLNLFKDNPNLLIWGGDLTSPEAYQLANSLRVTKFPFLGLLCLTRSTTMSPNGPVKTAPKISLVLKLQGGLREDIDLDELITKKFQLVINKYKDELGLIRNELRDKFISQVLLKQQDINYQNSLLKDSKKKQEKLYKQKKKEYLSHKAKYFRELLKEDPQGKARIAIKHSNGERQTFFFDSLDKVESIFIYVEVYKAGYLDDTAEISDTNFPDSYFEDFKLSYSFKLSSPLPPRIALNDYLEKEIREMECIYPNGVLVVEEL